MILTANGVLSVIADHDQAQKPVPPVYHLQEAFDGATGAFKNFQDAMSGIPDEQWDPHNVATGTGNRGLVPFPSPPIELLERGLDMLNNTFQAYKTSMVHTDRKVEVQRPRSWKLAARQMSKKPINAHNRPKLPVRGAPILVPRFGQMSATSMEGPSSMSISDYPQSGEPHPTRTSSPALTDSVIDPDANAVPSKSLPPSQVKPAAENMGKKPSAKSGTKLPPYLKPPMASNVAGATVQGENSGSAYGPVVGPGNASKAPVEPASEVTRQASSGPKAASSTSEGNESMGPPASAASKKGTTAKATGRVNKGNGSAEAPSKIPREVATGGKNTGRASQSDALSVSSRVDEAPIRSGLVPNVSSYTNPQNTDNAPYISPYANRQDTGDATYQSPYTNPLDMSSGGRQDEGSASTGASSPPVKPTRRSTAAPATNLTAERPQSTQATLAAMFAPSRRRRGEEEQKRARPAKRAGEESEEAKARGEKRINSLYDRRW